MDGDLVRVRSTQVVAYFGAARRPRGRALREDALAGAVARETPRRRTEGDGGRRARRRQQLRRRRGRPRRQFVVAGDRGGLRAVHVLRLERRATASRWRIFLPTRRRSRSSCTRSRPTRGPSRARARATRTSPRCSGPWPRWRPRRRRRSRARARARGDGGARADAPAAPKRARPSPAERLALSADRAPRGRRAISRCRPARAAPKRARAEEQYRFRKDDLVEAGNTPTRRWPGRRSSRTSASARRRAASSGTTRPIPT